MTVSAEFAVTRAGRSVDVYVTGSVSGGYGRVDEICDVVATCACGRELELSGAELEKAEYALSRAAIKEAER